MRCSKSGPLGTGIAVERPYLTVMTRDGAAHRRHLFILDAFIWALNGRPKTVSTIGTPESAAANAILMQTDEILIKPMRIPDLVDATKATARKGSAA